MSESKEAPKGWTDAEKVGLYFQIIERAGPIPWDDLTLPEGRTLKACKVMIDKEKQKLKKAREAAGEPPLETPKGKSKRKADGETETPASSAKKSKGRKKKGEEAKEASAETEENDKAEEGVVKAEENDD